MVARLWEGRRTSRSRRAPTGSQSSVGICTYVENAMRPIQHHTLDGYMNTLKRRRKHITECTQKRSTPPPILAYENVASHSLCEAMHMALVQFL